MRLAIIALYLFAASTVLAQDGEITFESTEVVPGIYMTIGTHSGGGFGGGNLGFIVGDDYLALVDDGIVPSASTLYEHIEEVTGRPVDFIINTHYHGDHTGANALFAESGTVIFAHHNIRKRLLEDVKSAGGDGGVPVVTFGKGVTFHLNGFTAHVKHLPSAHTDGDAIIYFEDTNVIFAGDIRFNGRFPYIDLGGGGTVDGYIAALQTIAGMADDETRILSGHGPLGTLADLERDLAMLVDGRARVKELIDAGMSEDDVMGADPLAGYADAYDWSFITSEVMTRTLYKDLSTNN